MNKRMEVFTKNVTPNEGVKTDKKVTFCVHIGNQKECKLCENVFKRKNHFSTTTVHQVKKDIVSYVTQNRNDMIADIGCPNSVISNRDVSNFVQNLSKFQQQNLEMVSADDKFKFGPSGPFECREKLRFPIEVDSKLFWVEVAVVDADIPMLLGNNIFKPLGAVIKLFASGNGVIELNEVEIPLKETTGGHYIVKVTDLGKLCEKFKKKTTFCATTVHNCKECNQQFESNSDYENHRLYNHRENKSGYNKSAMKIRQKDGNTSSEIFQRDGIVPNKTCLHKVETDLNTIQNGSKSRNEKRLILIVKQLAHQVKKEDSDVDCELCNAASLNFQNKTLQKAGNEKPQEKNPVFKCDVCGKLLVKNNKEVQSMFRCEKCANNYTEKVDFSSHKGNEHESIFMVHHVEEEDDCEFQMDPAVWNILLSENCDDGLTEIEKKEILKLHRYFAHRSGQKLWENLLQPAGRFKGKKRLVLEFLGTCTVCRKFKKTPPRPKVGLPKSKDVNEVVSMDLKIFQKDGKKKQIGILYLHDEFSN